MKTGVLIIGTGNMGCALISGWINAKIYSKKSIYAYDVNSVTLNNAYSLFGINCVRSLDIAIKKVTHIIIAVKPADVKNLLESIKDFIDKDKVVISIAAGINLNTIQSILGKNIKVVRIMPNTPALIGSGISAIAAGKNVNTKELSIVEKLFKSVGETVIVQEKMMNAITGLSGSGPAFVYMFIESLIDGGIKEGLPADIAKNLAVNTVIGSCLLVKSSKEGLSTLRHRVTSPKGTTIAGCKALEDNKFRSAVMSAVEASAKRSAEIEKDNSFTS